MKWNESGFRPPLCTYRLNWARRTSWGWWDDWDDTVLQTQDSKFEPWRSEAEHATSRSRRLPTILTFTRGWGRNNFVSFKPPRPGTEPRTLAWKAAVLTTTLGPPPRNAMTVAIATHPLSTMRIHRSLGIFVIIFTQFSLVSQSILNRFSRNFAGTISWYHGNCTVNMTKFDEVLQKFLMRLLWNFLEYFQKLFMLTSIQTSILYRLSCNFTGTISRYYGNFPVNLAKFD